MSPALMRPPAVDGHMVFERSRKIASVLTAHGLGVIVDHTGLRRFAPLAARGGRVAPPLTQPARLRTALGELGATFIKLGQTLSTRADLIPIEYVTELEKLQDAAPPVPIAAIRRTIEEEFGRTPEELFERFEAEPLASASIGQVHAALLHDGSEVVVKVRRPGVKDDVERDLQILRSAAEWLEEHTAFGRDYDLQPLVEEFAFTIHNELDYVREGQNAERFRRLFKGERSILVPRVYWDTTSPRVLTLERMRGIKITDLDALDRAGISRRTVAQNAVRTFLKQVFEFGIFHADPHPGNFFVQPDGTVALLDYGMVGRVSDALATRLLRAGLAALEEDAEALAEELYTLGVVGQRARRPAFQKDLDHLIGRYGGYTLRDLSATIVANELGAIAFRHRLQLPSELALLCRVVAMSEGIGLALDPDFHFFEYASPLIKSRWLSRHTVRATAARVGRAASEALELGTELPRRTGRLLGRIERGELELTVQHEGLDRVTREFQGMTNRLAMAVVLGASVVALAVALGIQQVPVIQRHASWLFPLSLLFSLAFGAWLLWSVWRSSRH